MSCDGRRQPDRSTDHRRRIQFLFEVLCAGLLLFIALSSADRFAELAWMVSTECPLEGFPQGNIARIREDHLGPCDRLQRGPMQTDTCGNHGGKQYTSEAAEQLGGTCLQHDTSEKAVQRAVNVSIPFARSKQSKANGASAVGKQPSSYRKINVCHSDPIRCAPVSFCLPRFI